eukprot:6012309-Prymnesium_polylepis.1
MTSAADCDVCGEGTFCPVGSAEATPCAAGTYNDRLKQEKCLLCDPGSKTTPAPPDASRVLT